MMNLQLLACAVCMGISDAPLARGLNAGVLVLLGVTTTMLGGIAVAIGVFARRIRLSDRQV